VKWVLLVIVVSLAWYLLADRFTPYTQQARVGAFVIPVAAEVSGRVIRVNVRNNQDVKAGDVIFEIDPQPYQIAVDRARADLESTRRQVGASTAGIASAQANCARRRPTNSRPRRTTNGWKACIARTPEPFPCACWKCPAPTANRPSARSPPPAPKSSAPASRKAAMRSPTPAAQRRDRPVEG
jgi:pyruvate/2-oxoglutarate dehydrogenase complex dihydrolipoamide acyltransferase (E2) component